MTSRYLLAAGAVLLGLGPALPAAAEDTAATITVVGGTLSIAAPTSAGSLGTRASADGAGPIAGQLGEVKVTDARSAPPGSEWAASVIGTEFAPPSGPAIPPSAVSYTVGSVTKVGTATLLANNRMSLALKGPVVTATLVNGDNTATWNPTVTVNVPNGMAAGVYSGTITHSVL